MRVPRAPRKVSPPPTALYERIKQLILDQKFAPGDPLPEEELARTLGVSRTPVHEALVRLEKDRLVVLRPFKGASVRKMTMEDVQELFQIREALEGVVARLAAESFEGSQLRLIERNCTLLARHGQSGDPQTLFETARDFHWILLRGVHNDRIREILTNIRDQLSVVRRYLLNNPDKIAADLKDHPQILAAIRRRDPDEAEQIMRRHIRAMRSALAGALR